MKIACMQVPPVGQDVPAALSRLEAQARAARAEDCTVLVAPEMYLSGYNIGAEAVARLAELQDGPMAKAVASIARREGIAILFGFPERASEDGRVYNSVQLVDATGQACCTYRKTHLFGEVDASQFSAGDRLSPVVELDGWRVAVAICFDIEFPELARAHALAGAEVLLVPTANMIPYLSVPRRLVPARAEENGIFIAYANYTGQEDAFAYCGLSCICDPFGTDLARAGETETLIHATLDPARIAEARRGVNYLRDRRPSLYKLATGKDAPHG